MYFFPQQTGSEQEFQEKVQEWLTYQKISLESGFKHYNLKEEGNRQMLTNQINSIINKIKDIPIPYESTVEFYELKNKILNRLKEVEQEIVDKGEWRFCKFENKNEATLPAGSYYVGDICYVIGDDDTDENGNKIYKSVIYQEGFHTNGKHIIGVYHTGDDGAWEDTKGRIYGVDAGNIGIVPAELCSSKRFKNFRQITINNEFKFGWKGRKIYLEDPVNSENSFEIDLDRVDSDYDDD